MAESKRKSLWNLIRAKSTAIRNFKDVSQQSLTSRYDYRPNTLYR